MVTQLARDAHGRLLVDVRGPRFAAVLTTVVLGAALVLQGPVGRGLIAWQWLVFAVASVGGLRASLYGNLFRFVKRTLELGPPPETEPEAPVRFAQACGLVVLTVAGILHAVGATTSAWIAAGVVLALSALLASTGICVGCELWLLGERLRRRR
ncbi:MAG: DUF4395 domain-containing protein [Nitriliruptoraceae bacterium]